MSRCAPSQGISLREVFPHAQILGASDVQCVSCHADGEAVQPGGVLFAGAGDSLDLAREVLEAVARGASAIVTEQFLPSPIPQIIVSDVHEALSQAAHAVAGHPSRKVLTIGVVGTHGKTTAALLTASMLKHVGNRVGYHCTLGGSNGAQTGLPCSPDTNAIELARFSAASVENGCPALVIEITDEMLLSRGTTGWEFDVLLFTSLRKSQRLDKLRSRGVENALQRLMGQVKKHGVIVYNADDARLNRWIERYQPHAIGYGLDAACDVMGKRMERASGSQSMMVQMGRSIAPITTKLLGDPSARHILGAAAIGYAFGLEVDEIIGGIERLQRIPGRLQLVPSSHRKIAIDLADQADRLAVSMHSLSRHSESPIVCVAEVPEAATAEQLMAYGKVLERVASKVILTQSRESTLSGQRSLWHVLDGCEVPSAIEIVPNRETAIELAIRSSKPTDQILLVGWGSARWTTNRSEETKCDFEVAERVLREIGDDRDPTPAAGVVSKEGADRPALKIYDAA